jgi:hypothetical protein
MGSLAYPDIDEIKLVMEAGTEPVPIKKIWSQIEIIENTPTGDPATWYIEVWCRSGKFPYNTPETLVCYYTYSGEVINGISPKLVTFPLTNIDAMKMDIIDSVTSPAAFVINGAKPAPYSLPLYVGTYGISQESGQEGLGIKTYQSDIYNNWIQTEWIDGDDGINAITAVDTSTGSFTMDSLLMARKVYDMLNRIAMSGGSYEDWQDAVYTHERTRTIDSPIYMGGLSRELAFQEVVSNASATSGNQVNQPLGTLAGRGVLTNKKKGGKIRIRINEPSYIMGIVSLTPRIDYSQGNKWDVNLKTMNDLHKPALDGIGFQDLVTDEMAWWDTDTSEASNIKFYSVGKVPAWMNYMTRTNQNYGNFAEKYQQMFMTINRRYEADADGYISDKTTYVDPSKFNYIFADTRLDAQNFWIQIKVDNIARRKMSAKIMPNL